jgi:putative ATP-binding cassette transporter
VFWRSAKGFWGKNGDRLAWILTIGTLIIILANLAVQYGINVWNRWIFDALADRNADRVLFLSTIFLPLAIGSIGFGVANVFMRMTVQRRWRAWLSMHVVDRWLANGRYYQLDLVSGDHENPEYRIAEDLRIATDAPVDFVVAIISAVLSVATFSGVLWAVGGAIEFTAFGSDISIPGFLVIAALIYSILASGAMVIIGRYFVRVSENKNQSEAEYRYALTRVRENGESIGLLKGDQEERAGLERILKMVLHRWRQLCAQYMRTTIVFNTSTVVAPVIPIILSAPKFLDESMSLGEVMQAASAFTIVQAAFSVLVEHYPRFAEWSASARRGASLMVSLNSLERSESGEGIERIERRTSKKYALRLCNLSVTLDDGTAVVDDTDVRIMPGERLLVAGESGTGKSTLVRAIAGLWPWGGGAVEIKEDARLFLLPQKPYVPIGPLMRAVTYPAPTEEFPLKEMAAALEATGLGYLVQRLDEDSPWDQIMSGGEKQRLAFARLLLHKPDIIVLDEATSALDPQSQDELMALIAARLPDATIVSVGHRPELEAFHRRKVVLERRRGGAKLISDIALVRPRPRRRLIAWRARRRRPA